MSSNSNSVDVVHVISGNNNIPLDISTTNLFIGFGVVAIILNLLTILVSISIKDIAKKSAFAIGLSFGDIIFGCGLVITGVLIQSYIKNGLLLNEIHPFECLKKFSTLWLIGIQAPASIIFLMGSERVLGIIFFQWYFKRWTSKLSWMLVAVAYGFCLISISAVWIVVYQLPPNTMITISCKTQFVIGPAYATYNYGLSILCGISAVISTICSLIAFLRKRASMGHGQADVAVKRFVKRQIRMATSMLIISIIDCALVVIPNIMLLMISYDFNFPPSFKYLSAHASLLYCTRSSLSFFVYLSLNRDFRSAAFAKFFSKSMKISQSSAAVAPSPK